MPELRADYIVVGGGTAGCVVASRLAQALHTVILIEAGTDEHANPVITSPVGAPRLHHTELEWNYKTVNQPALNDRQIYNCAGKVLSGSSAVNYGMWTRGDAADYDDWAKVTGDERWGYQSLLPYFRRVEKHYNAHGDIVQHGFDGPIHLTSGERFYPLKSNVHAALLATGHPNNADANSGNPIGISAWTENWRNHARQPAGVAYPVTNVQVLTSSLAARIILDSTASLPRATGVLLASGTTVHASREVIVACGSLRSPQLLLLSGIGPPAELAKHNIMAVVHNPFIGAALHDHVSLIQFHRLTPRYAEQGASAGSPVFAARSSAEQGLPFDYVTTNTALPAILAAAIDKDGGQGAHVLEPVGRAHTEMFIAYTVLGRGNPAHSAPIDGSYVSTAVLLLSPTSRGSITLHSTDPADAPRIDPNYLATHADRTMLREGMRAMLRVVANLVDDGVIAGEKAPEGFSELNVESSDDEIDMRVREFAATMYHPCGSVGMGTALDSDLKVKGVEGLRVIDASAFPGVVAGHPQAAVYALAERGADLIKENVPKGSEKMKTTD